MAPCTSCLNSNSLYVSLSHSSKCSSYVRKNVAYNGIFSTQEFNSLSAQRQKIREASQRNRDRMSEIALKIIRLQRQQASLERQLESVSEIQSKIIKRELSALDGLDNAVTSLEELPPSSNVQSNSALYAFDDAQLAALLAGASS